MSLSLHRLRLCTGTLPEDARRQGLTPLIRRLYLSSELWIAVASFDKVWDEIDLPEDSPSTEELRRSLAEDIYNSIEKKERVIIKSPTAVGKSYLVASAFEGKSSDYSPEEHGKILHLSQTKTARKEAKKTSKKASVHSITLEGREDACPVAKGDHDTDLSAPDGLDPSEWFEKNCDFGGVRFGDAHSKLDDYVDGGLPCMEGRGCDSVNQYQSLADDPAIIHATHNFAYVEDMVEGRNVVFDERPSFTETYDDGDQNRFKKSINNYFQEAGLGYSWETLLSYFELGNDEGLAAIREGVKEDLEGGKSTGWDSSSGYSYLLAPEAILAITNAEKVIESDEELEQKSLYLGEQGRLKIVFDGGNNIRASRRPPDLSEARSVICLDAYPCSELWELNIGIEGMEIEQTATAEEKQEWRVGERNLYIVQIGESAFSFTNGWTSDGARRKSRQIIERLREKYGEDFRSCIVAVQLQDEIDNQMEESGIDEEYKTLHYGEQKSDNSFKGERVGCLIGCNDIGDGNALPILALLGKKAMPEKKEEEERKDEQDVRKEGRGFVGPDSEVAESIVESTRRENVAQAAGRFAREPDEDESKAIVYVWSNVLTQELVDYEMDEFPKKTEGGSVTEKWRIHELLRNSNELMTAKQISEHKTIDCSKEHVQQNVLNELDNEEVLEVSKGTGKWNAYEYRLLDPHVDLRC